MQEIFIQRQATVNYVQYILKTFKNDFSRNYQNVFYLSENKLWTLHNYAQMDFVVLKYFKICIWTFKQANIASVCW